MKQFEIEWVRDMSIIDREIRYFDCLALCMDYAQLQCSYKKADKAYIYENDDPQERIAVYP